MKLKLLIIPLCFIFQFSFSQTEMNLKGTVKYEDFILHGIEVLNLASKRTTKTDTNGQFILLAKAEDTLLFVSKNYEYKKLVIKKEDLYLTNLTVSLTRKPEELEEVLVVTKIAFPHIGFNQEYADKSSIEKAAKNPKPIGVYDGTLVNSPDLMRIGKMILDLFKNKKENNKVSDSNIGFKDIALTTYEEDFYIKTLQL